VGDIDIAYKQLGNGSSSDIPIVLISGGGVTIDRRDDANFPYKGAKGKGTATVKIQLGLFPNQRKYM